MRNNEDLNWMRSYRNIEEALHNDEAQDALLVAGAVLTAGILAGGLMVKHGTATDEKNLGNQYMADNNYSSAIKHFNQSLEMAIDETVIRNLAKCYVMVDNLDYANRCYNFLGTSALQNDEDYKLFLEKFPVQKQKNWQAKKDSFAEKFSPFDQNSELHAITRYMQTLKDFLSEAEEYRSVFSPEDNQYVRNIQSEYDKAELEYGSLINEINKNKKAINELVKTIMQKVQEKLDYPYKEIRSGDFRHGEFRETPHLQTKVESLIRKFYTDGTLDKISDVDKQSLLETMADKISQNSVLYRPSTCYSFVCREYFYALSDYAPDNISKKNETSWCEIEDAFERKLGEILNNKTAEEQPRLALRIN